MKNKPKEEIQKYTAEENRLHKNIKALEEKETMLHETYKKYKGYIG